MDLTDLAIQPGKVHLVREILHNGVTGSVRVLGRYALRAGLAITLPFECSFSFELLTS